MFHKTIFFAQTVVLLDEFFEEKYFEEYKKTAFQLLRLKFAKANKEIEVHKNVKFILGISILNRFRYFQIEFVLAIFCFR